jgi:predicted DsbA family dithiol-disulfide isomerase
MNTPSPSEPVSLTIDFVSDVSCPWCAVGLGALEQALQSLAGEVDATLTFQPFELNPAMGPAGEDIGEHLTRKYGSTPAQQAQIRDTIRARGAEVGFAFHPDGRGRIWNTFDAHRLLHWAAVTGAPGQQRALKKALLAACHTRREPMADPAVLVACAREAGLDADEAARVLASGAYAQAVRERQNFYTSHGIHSVPAVIVNERHLISGGQPAAVFEQALRQIAAGAA